MSGAGRTLVVLRHGQTAYNAAARIQGQRDVELDETGHDQAARAAVAVAALGPDLLWSSDLARARQTAAYVAEETGLEPVLDPRLREFFLAEREELTHAEYAALAPEEYAGFRRGDFDVVPGGERAREVGERMTEALHDLLAATPEGGTALAVSHGAAVRVATGALLGWADGAFHTLRGLDNCGWVVLREDPEAGGLRLAAYNRVAPTP